MLELLPPELPWLLLIAFIAGWWMRRSAGAA